MTTEEIKDELYRMLSDVVNGGYPKRTYAQQTRYKEAVKRTVDALDILEQMSHPEKPNKWIPVSKRLPEELEPVNITWVNHNPKSYYADIKDKPFTATGYYCKGKWYWFSSTCKDYLREYGRCDVDEIDADVEVTAWMPLPTSYKAESEEV